MIARIIQDLCAAIALGLVICAVGIWAATAARACDVAAVAAAGSGFVGAALFGALGMLAAVAIIVGGILVGAGPGRRG